MQASFELTQAVGRLNQGTASSVQCMVCSVDCAVCGVQCMVCSTQCAECSVYCAMFRAQCVVFGVGVDNHRYFCPVSSLHIPVSQMSRNDRYLCCQLGEPY